MYLCYVDESGTLDIPGNTYTASILDSVLISKPSVSDQSWGDLQSAVCWIRASTSPMAAMACGSDPKLGSIAQPHYPGAPQQKWQHQPATVSSPPTYMAGRPIPPCHPANENALACS